MIIQKEMDGFGSTKKVVSEQVLLAHACNPSYLES
jgi:hypothetical protein